MVVPSTTNPVMVVDGGRAALRLSDTVGWLHGGVRQRHDLKLSEGRMITLLFDCGLKPFVGELWRMLWPEDSNETEKEKRSSCPVVRVRPSESLRMPRCL